MATAQSLPAGNGPVEPRQDGPLEDMPSPILPSDAEFDSNEEQQPPTRSPTPTPPPGPTPLPSTVGSLPPNNSVDGSMPALPPLNQQSRPAHRTLPVPAPLRRNNSSSFTAFNEIPSLPAFLNNCNLSQYLQSFNDAGATDDSMPLIIDFDDDELKSIMEAIPMKPFHAVTFRKGIRDLRERSRMGSMHFDNSQSSFMQPEPHSMLHYSHSQFFQQSSQLSQPSQASHPSQSSLNSSQPTRGYTFQGGSSQNPGLYRQSSASKSSQRQQGNPSSQTQSYTPTPSQVLSAGSIYQYVGPAPRGTTGGNFPAQPVPLYSQDQSPLQRTSSKQNDHRQLKRRRSTSGTPPDQALDGSSPVLPEPSSFNSNSSSSWSSTPNPTSSSSQQPDKATRDLIMHQALIYGKHSSRSLTKYEHAINCAAQSLALEEPSLLTNKGQLWNKAKAKLLEEDYDYKRGKSRSKLPEAAQKKENKASKERLIQKREANASNAATIRLRRIASLGEQLHRKTADREALLAQLLRLESPEYKQSHPGTYEAEALYARESLNRVENERQSISKELGSLKNKERKHQWYEKRKKDRAENGERSEQDDKNTNAGTDAEADEEAETDTTVDPEGDASQKSLTGGTGALDLAAAQRNNMVSKMEAAAAQKPLTWKAHNPTPPSAINDGAKAAVSRAKRKDVFRVSEYTPVVKS
ncbi:hypothetical protein BC939DRAFT_248551 [Gamsiella multidivaricata]|uniref:uncharacterized protein n=1 Tax=Gamsiella multidivaricata TaxID=101098 RepID=UPI00221F6238|nr:uncharacterized protein BC939DRAFT_248551 [Gamsiella multidivaricata]KAG0364448.1 hypothetical protein BGZ54_007524 [Gamsiella multidivaricata]KAI7819813.1 hypothetical protein BC939DRAFT_248551 [Gamsiella multidivaricata]